MPKFRSAKTGEYIKAKAAKKSPATTFKSNDYPTRALRKLVRIIESKDLSPAAAADKIFALVPAIKKKMGWR